MKTKDSYEQAYNCQAAVDSESQVIVAQCVTSEQNDGPELVGLVEHIEALTKELPEQISADAGYCSEENIVAMKEAGVDPYIATGRQKHGTSSATSEDDKKKGPRTIAMKEKLKAGGYESPYGASRKFTVLADSSLLANRRNASLWGRGNFRDDPYRLRRQVVEPVFGQIKEAQGFRQFLHRGLDLVSRDWAMVCATHDLLKLFGYRKANGRGLIGGHTLATRIRAAAPPQEVHSPRTSRSRFLGPGAEERTLTAFPF